MIFLRKKKGAQTKNEQAPVSDRPMLLQLVSLPDANRFSPALPLYCDPDGSAGCSG